MLERCCDHPDCAQQGVHRAPRARNALRIYYWFCLDHVRSYNLAWNFCANMSSDDIEAQLQRDTVWDRPSWRFGTGRSQARNQFDETIDDPLGLFRGNFAKRGNPGTTRPASGPRARALKILALQEPVVLHQVKSRYKELAKRYHPDANGGCKKSEDRLKSINEAYTFLRKTLIA